MCGIVGIIGHKAVGQDIIKGLEKLKYRGYDSSGIATMHGKSIKTLKAVGKLTELINKTIKNPDLLSDNIGIGHIRWASHGEVNEINAHPHSTKECTMVHNGIIENAHILKNNLIKNGKKFISDTDTEVAVQFLQNELDNGNKIEEAFYKMVQTIKGSYAIAVMTTHAPGKIFFARNGCPLCILVNSNISMVASDPIVLNDYDNNAIFLEDGDWGYIEQNHCQIFDIKHNEIKRKKSEIKYINYDVNLTDSYKHNMLKEIYEQPYVISQILEKYCDHQHILMPELEQIKPPSSIIITGCGTAYYAAIIAKYIAENLLNIPIITEVASELCYKNYQPLPNSLFICISQSGETADTLNALHWAKDRNLKTIGIVNVTYSTIARLVDIMLPTMAGEEKSVASTKAFSAQLLVLTLLINKIASKKTTENKVIGELITLPNRIKELLHLDSHIRQIAKKYIKSKSILYIGRGVYYPIALEGALKMKELAYIHAEALVGGELKHGAIALIDNKMPVVVIAPSGPLLDKIIINAQAVAARNGKLITFCDYDGESELSNISEDTILLPKASNLAQIFLYLIPLQLLAYHAADLQGNDVDQPRNLAKSVTIE